MTTKRWFLPESPDLLAMLHNQAAITVQAMDALVAWSNGDTTAVRWSAQVPLQHRLARTYRSGPLFLAGDAAHTHSPAGGQGMNTGLQDATNLGWKLAYALQGADSVGTTTLLDSYQLERRPVARHVMTLTNVAFWAEAGTDPLARAARTIAATIGPPSNQASTSSSNATPSRQTPAPSPELRTYTDSPTRQAPASLPSGPTDTSASPATTPTPTNSPAGSHFSATVHRQWPHARRRGRHCHSSVAGRRRRSIHATMTDREINP
jgi:hypothetical protein